MSSKTRFMFLFLILCIIILKAREQDTTKPAVAIIGLESNGVSKPETRAITDRFSTELFKCGQYKILERAKMEAILQEMNFQISGCTSSECAVKVGRIVGVEKIITGSISQVAEYNTVNIRLIDVETSQIENTVTRDVKGSLGKVLTRAIPELAAEISGLEKENSYDSSIQIKTTPAGALVYLDDSYLGTTPLTSSLSPFDTHEVKLVKEGYKIWKRNYNLKKNKNKELDIFLTKVAQRDDEKSARIIVKTTPDQAKLYLNGNHIGFSPKNIDVKAGRSHHLKIKKNNYQTWEKYYRLKTAEIEKVDVHLINNSNRRKEDNKSGSTFHIRYTQLNVDNEINTYIYSLINRLRLDNPFYGPVQSKPESMKISNFSGIEFWNNNNPNDFLSFNFRVGLYRADFDDWISGWFEDREPSRYDINFWNPQISADLQIAPFDFPLIRPFANIGYGYNLLIMVPQKDGKNKEAITFHAPGFYWGFGIQLKPLPFMGFALDYNWRNMDMEIMETNDLSDRFIEKEIDKLDISNNNVGISIIFYH